jgi:hypothetical protein
MRTALIVGVVFAGCQPIPSATISQDISGNIYIDSSCNASETAVINSAMNVLMTRLEGAGAPAFDDCVLNAFISEDLGRPVEQILNEMTENKITSFYCADSKKVDCGGQFGWQGCAQVSSSDESLQLDHTYLGGAPAAAELAGVIMHEVAHTHSFDHDNVASSFEYEMTVTEQLKWCMSAQAPFEAKRSDLPGEVELAHVGGAGSDNDSLLILRVPLANS